MKKNRILGFVNIVLGLLFLFLFILSIKTILLTITHLSLSTLIHSFLVLTALLINGTLAYFLLRKKIKIKSLKLFLVLTLSPLLWLLLTFFGFFFSLYLSYLFLTIILSVIVFLLVYKISQRIALILSLVTFLTAIFGIASGFEERYCIAKGKQAEKDNPSTVTATKEDAEYTRTLKGLDIKSGQKITSSFRTHMLCHTTFDLGSAIKDTYFPK